MILSVMSEEEEGVSTNSFTFEGSPVEWAQLMELQPAISNTNLMRAVERIAAQIGDDA